MSGGGEYEPKDSRKATGTAGDPKKSWREQEDARSGRGEYEPRDTRNVTGQAAEEEDRWQKEGIDPSRADGAAVKASGKQPVSPLSGSEKASSDGTAVESTRAPADLPRSVNRNVILLEPQCAP